MGLFNIFNKNKDKKENKVPEYFSITSDLIGQICDLASRYSINEEFLDTYSKEKLDVNSINNAREILEKCLIQLGKSEIEYYNNEYSIVGETSEENKNFTYSLDAIIAIFNNSLDLYSDNEEVRDDLNYCYDKCNKELAKAKEVLSDNEAIKAFTGLSPIEKIDVELEQAKKLEEAAIEEEIIQENNLQSNDEVNNDSDDVDGDVIVDTDSMKVYFIRKIRNEDDEMGLSLCIKNKLNIDITFEAKDVYVDGREIVPQFICNIKAGKIKYDEIVFPKSITELANISCTFVMKEIINNEVVSESQASIL